MEARGRVIKDVPAYTLVKNQGDDYAFYYRKLEFGFGQAIEIQTYVGRENPKRRLVGVKWLSGNSFGLTPEGKPRSPSDPFSMNWQTLKEAFYATQGAALGAIEGKMAGGKGGYKPIEPLKEREIREYLEL